jgi:seryl-tRNA(Sec) selenium transferase
VSSRLTKGAPIDLGAAAATAHKHGVPAVSDDAAQDFRVRDLLQTGADLVIVSAQKYLGGPTAGLIVGRQPLIAAVRAQERGSGRAMKASKEAIAGALAAISERSAMDEAD